METVLTFNIYLLYGLAFIAIFFSILFQDLSRSRIAISHSLPILAAFGFLHGLHEWSELYIIVYQDELANFHHLQSVKTVKLWVSYIALGAFAWSMLGLTQWRHTRFIKGLVLGILSFFVVSLALRYGTMEYSLYLTNTATQIRWIFGLGAGLLTGATLFQYANVLDKEGHDASQPFKLCGFAFACYGISTSLLTADMGLWVIFIRTLCACAILVTLLRALKVFDNERNMQFEYTLTQSLHDEKLKELGELSSAIAHEIKTPLSSAMMRCDILEHHLADNTTHLEQLARIRTALDRAAHISQETLNYAHQKPIRREKVNVETVLNAVMSINQFRLEDNHVRLKCDSSLWVDGDEGLLEQACSNLLSNAIDVSQNQQPIEINAYQDRLFAVISVTDAGGGIPKQHVDKVTQPFFTTKPKGEGTGMGLAVVKQVAMQHNGTLILRNHKQGLRAELRIPRSI